MKIDAITTSVNYADYLEHTISNSKHFDSFTVVTTEDDIETQQLTLMHKGASCSVADFGPVFNKGKAINKAIKELKDPEWIVLIDSDIVLPPMTRHILERLRLNEQCIYGIDRMNCPSKAEWDKYRNSSHAQHENSTWIHSGPWVTMTRVMSLKHGGYIPMGFFQMFHVHADAVVNGFYPENYEDAGNSDLIFAAKWPRENRQLLPEFIGIHLCTQDLTTGANWQGRITKDFA